MAEATIDRRVQITRDGKTETVRLSQLRDRPYLVLLGEPGIGKSSSLRKEAADEGGMVVTCRELMNGVSLAGNATAYLDALDEYRSGGDRKDKVQQIGIAMAAAGLERWRLTCRAEDWRAAADLTAITRAAPGAAIEVATLLPLDDEEAEAVLVALGQTSPARFIGKAKQHGAQAFLESPLSLRLLNKAVGSAGGQWPATRFDLFTLAIGRLAHEWDPERVTDSGYPASQIIEAAGSLCLYMLTTSAAGLWRSRAALPDDAPDLVPIEQLPLEPALARATLDTALFRREDNVFEPIHRTIAEFLAGAALARAVAGSREDAAFPLSRALALISAPDGKAPSELRGLYAWFAAHLAKQGDEAGALRLVRTDAATVLAYGDAAVFSTAARIALLRNLDSEDPFFRASTRSGTTALGGLAGADLVEEFKAILTGPGKNTDLLLTVYNALEEGPALPQLEPTLRAIAFDKKQSVHYRWRAGDLLIHYADDPQVARQGVLDQLGKMTVDRNQVSLRLRFLSEVPPDMLAIAEVRKLLSDYAHLPKANRRDETGTGEFFRLGRLLRDNPRPELFDTPILPPLSNNTKIIGRSYALGSLISTALAGAIRRTPDLTPAQLSQWVINAREHRWDDTDSDVMKAIGEWLDKPGEHRDVELARQLLAADDPTEGPWMIRYHYVDLVKREPTTAVFEFVLDQAMAESVPKRRKRLMAIATHLADGRNVGPEAHWRMLEVLGNETGVRALVALLESTSLKGRKYRELQRKAKQNAKTARIRKTGVGRLRPALGRIAAGDPTEFGNLHWGAEAYHQGQMNRPEALMSLEDLGDEATTAAVLEGLTQFTLRGTIDVTVEDLGQNEAKNTSFAVEAVIAAGIHRAIATGRLDQLAATPLLVALVGMRQYWRFESGAPSVKDWALGRLSDDPDAGADLLVAYWNAALDTGDHDLDGWHHLDKPQWRELARRAVQRLVHARPDLPDEALVEAIRLVAAHDPQDLATMAAAALAATLSPAARSIWTFVALVLDPKPTRAAVGDDAARECLKSADDELGQLLQPLSNDAVALDAARVELIGPETAPDPNDWRKTASDSGRVRNAISRLAAVPDTAAGDVLRKLVDTPALTPWRPDLQHALAEYLRLRRDLEFRGPTIAQITEAMSGGKPANPRDLRAVVVEVLRRYQSTMRTSPLTPWKNYWNTDKNGNATTPRIENECRDRLFEMLQIAMQKYQVIATMPEARRGENTRVDALLLSHAGMNLPIEAKRGHNDELWTAPDTQLRGYSADERAHGYGVYLVFWFGTTYRLPARKDGKTKPTTAQDLEDLLVQDLPDDLKETVDVVVLDVSRAANAVPKPPKAKPAAKAKTATKAKTTAKPKTASQPGAAKLNTRTSAATAAPKPKPKTPRKPKVPGP